MRPPEKMYEMAERKRMEISELSPRQTYLPRVFSEAYKFLRKRGTRRTEFFDEFIRFRRELFRKEPPPNVYGIQVLVANFFLRTENKPVPMEKIKNEIGTAENPYPDVKYPLCKEDGRLIEKEESIILMTRDRVLIEQPYTLIEGVFYYSSCSLLFLGENYSLKALNLLSKRYPRQKFEDLVTRFIQRRITEIQSKMSYYYGFHLESIPESRIKLLQKTLNIVKSFQ